MSCFTSLFLLRRQRRGAVPVRESAAELTGCGGQSSSVEESEARGREHRPESLASVLLCSVKVIRTFQSKNVLITL